MSGVAPASDLSLSASLTTDNAINLIARPHLARTFRIIGGNLARLLAEELAEDLASEPRARLRERDSLL